jgi:hypothetical protein
MPMRIYNMDRTNHGRGLVMIVLICLSLASIAANFIGGVVGDTLAVVMLVLAVMFVVNFFSSRKLAAATWVQIDGNVVTWATHPKAEKTFAPSGTLDLNDATVIAVVPRPVELKAGPKTMTIQMLVLAITDASGRTVMIPPSTTTRQIGIGMERMLAALASVPSIVQVDTSALAGVAPRPTPASR